MPFSVLGIAVLLAFLIALGAVAWMIFSLARQKDERGEKIVAQAALHSLIIQAAVLALCAARNALEPVGAKWELDPFVCLAGLAVVFCVELLVWKRRWGG